MKEEVLLYDNNCRETIQKGIHVDDYLEKNNYYVHLTNKNISVVYCNVISGYFTCKLKNIRDICDTTFFHNVNKSGKEEKKHYMPL